jgi:crotonobetainyl-CoA:carnitine CoA-transferase CaiB-like acyl-CoA transferase
VPRGTYRTADGIWVAVSSSADSVASRVLDLLGLSGDTRFTTLQGRSKNRIALEKALGDWIGARPFEEVISEFRRVDAAIARVLDMKDIFADPHYAARHMIAEADGVKMQDVVARFSRTPGRLRHAGRALGADTRAVFERLEKGPK